MTNTSPPRRIAMMLESDGPGGAEVMALRLSEELRALGHSVVPVGPAHGIGWLGERYRAAGFAPEHFHLRGPLDPGCVRGLMQLFRRHQIDVVHSHEFTMAVYGAAASRLLGIPHVITLHGSMTVGKALRRRVALRWAMRASRRTVVVSESTRRQFAAEFGVRESSLVVVPNGVTVKPGQSSGVRAELGIPVGERVLLAVGTLEPRKGHRILLQALGDLVRAGLGERWHLIIAGGRGGPEHEPLQRLVGAEGLQGRVHILTNRNDIPDLLALTDIFVMPSLWEGLPMALLEAMLASKAVVASATSGIPEAIVDGRDGLLVTPGSISELAAALRVMLTDPDRRDALARAAGERARREFTARVMARNYETHYGAAPALRELALVRA
jgi:glycosyltransferase involved in cell wall biosynthesis